MKDFNLIGVRVYKDGELLHTRYFQIGEMKMAIDYARDNGRSLC